MTSAPLDHMAVRRHFLRDFWECVVAKQLSCRVVPERKELRGSSAGHLTTLLRMISLNKRLGEQNTTPIPQNLEPPITIEELNLAIKKTKPWKAPGPDLIPPEILINLDDGNRLDFLAFLNTLFEKELFPEAQQVAKIKVIRKAGNGDCYNPSSYRPISLLPIAGKVYERIIKQRLTLHLEQNALLSQHQYGFREKRSTLQAIEL